MVFKKILETFYNIFKCLKPEPEPEYNSFEDDPENEYGKLPDYTKLTIHIPKYDFNIDT
jgi:hypothetical protein